MRRLIFSLAAVPLALVSVACARGVVDDVTADFAATPGPSAGPEQNPLPLPAPGPVDEAPDAALEDAAADVLAPDAADAAETSTDSGPVIPPVTPPVLDGVIGASEYGAHVDGQNQQVSVAGNPTSTTWYLTWTESDLYVGVTAANVAEGVVLYIDTAPLTPSNGGTNADGTLVGNAYDTTRPTLPIRADFVAYVKTGYAEVRTANAANAWSGPNVGGLTVQTSGTTREIRIPWTLVRAAGRPAAFAWLGYATSAGGYAYGVMPPVNPGGAIGLGTAFGASYLVSDATPGAGTKPFAFPRTL